jgi:hypothetical protein
MSMSLNGSTSGAKYIVNDIERAQHCPEMFCQSHWIGIQMPHKVLSMLLNGLTNAIGTCRRCYWMGLHLPPMTMLMILNKPRNAAKYIVNVIE